MVCTKQMERKTNKGLLKAKKGGQGGKDRKGRKGRKGRQGGGGGISSGRGGGGGSGIGGSDGNGGNVPSGCFSKQLENRPPAAAPKWKKPYVRVFQEMKKLQRITKLCISKYQMAR